MSLTNEQLEELKKELLLMKRELERQDKVSEKPGSSDELTVVDNHLADSANGVVSREEQMAEESLREQRLQDVTDALERMENGTYGICVDSGEAIAYERLKAVPYAKRTVAAEEALDDQNAREPLEGRGPTSRLEQPEDEIEDERSKTMERLEEEHNRREGPDDFEEENRW